MKIIEDVGVLFLDFALCHLPMAFLGVVVWVVAM